MKLSFFELCLIKMSLREHITSLNTLKLEMKVKEQEKFVCYKLLKKLDEETIKKGGEYEI